MSVSQSSAADEPDDFGLASLTDRERHYLRLVPLHDNSAEIARAAGPEVTPNMVDKQLKRAMAKLGVDSRFKAARLLAEHEAPGYRPVTAGPDGGRRPAGPPSALPARRRRGYAWPVPTADRPVNDLNATQVLIWGGLIAISALALLTLAAALIEAIGALLHGQGR